MEINYIQCFQCGRALGHLYYPYRKWRDSPYFDQEILRRTFDWLEITPPNNQQFNSLYQQFAALSGDGTEEELEQAFEVIGRTELSSLKLRLQHYLQDMAKKELKEINVVREYRRTFQEIKVSVVFEQLKIYRYCCKTRLISPAIVPQQAPFPPEWSLVKIVPDPTVQRIVEIRNHKKLLKGVQPTKT